VRNHDDNGDGVSGSTLERLALRRLLLPSIAASSTWWSIIPTACRAGP
jgi:hypothetical protein